MDWDKVLQQEGLGLDRGRPSWLSYGHEHREVGNQSAAPAESSLYTAKKRLKPRQKVKQKIWGTPQTTTDAPDWGFAGGYTNEGKKVRVGPNYHRSREIKERELCSRLAVRTRSTKSAR